MVSSSASRSSVGCWRIAANELKPTIPISVPAGRSRTNADAASWAARSRVGSMSSAHMLPDTSIASRIVVWLDGTPAPRPAG